MIVAEKTTVAVGCSVDRDYSFLIPLTSVLWRDYIGFHPLVFLVGDKSEWMDVPATRVVVEAMKHHCIDYVFVGHIAGHSDVTVSQHVRHHAAAISSIDDSEWIMLTDADIWPLRKSFYRQHINFEGHAVCLYSNGDHFAGKSDVLSRFDAGGGVQSIPICHVSLRAKDWRDLYSIVPGDVVGSTKNTLDSIAPWVAKCPDQGLAKWCCDQWYLTERLCRQSWFPDAAPPLSCPPNGRVLASENVLLVERYGHPPADRLDRSCPSWGAYGTFDISRWTDAHVHKDPASEAHFADEMRVVDALLPQYSDWARKYRAEYVA